MSSLSIPWSKFKEEEIHTIICILFNSLKYSIKNLHQADRSNENGADIIVKKGKENIAIAVKIKPNKNDTPQLLELSKRKENRKIYIYTETPTKKFHDFMKLTKDDVDFWDVKKLDDFFRKNNPYFMVNIIFENSELHKNIEAMNWVFFELWCKSRENKKRKFGKINKESFFYLWRLKDISVTLHQSSNLFLPIVRKPMNFKSQKYDEHFFEIFSDYLEILNRKVRVFLKYFLPFYKKNKILVENSIKEVSSGSHWIYINNFCPMNKLSGLQKVLKKAIDDQKLIEELSKKFPKPKTNKETEKYYRELAKSNSVWQAMDKQVGEILSIGMATEQIVDDIIREYFQDYDYLCMLKSKVENGFEL